MDEKCCEVCGNHNDHASIIAGETWYCDFCDHENITKELESETEG